MFSGTITGCTQSGALTSHKRTQHGGLFAVNIVVMLLTVIAADAQSVSAQNQPLPRGTTIIVRGAGSYDCGRFFPYGAFAYGGYGMPGTAQSAADFGMASMIAASGYANLQNSQAAQNYMAARSQDFDNRLRWTRAYYHMRREHRAYVADHTRLSMDEFTKIAHDAAPKRLDPAQLDQMTGKIAWPIIMQDPRYATLTNELENLYRQRATVSESAGAENYRNIGKTCDELLDLLKRNINEYQPNDFIQARRLVKSLCYEARFPTSSCIDNSEEPFVEGQVAKF